MKFKEKLTKDELKRLWQRLVEADSLVRSCHGCWESSFKDDEHPVDAYKNKWPEIETGSEPVEK